MAASHDVDIPVVQGIGDGFAHSLQASEVDHRINRLPACFCLPQELVEDNFIADVPLYYLPALRRVL